MAKNVITLTISPDPDIENPKDMDLQWLPVSFDTRNHRDSEDAEKYFTTEYEWERSPYSENAYLVPVRCKPNNIGLRRKLEVGTAFWMIYSEHGNCEWKILKNYNVENYPKYERIRPDGILLFPHDPKEMGAKTYEERAKDAEAFLTTYTDWCNGDGWTYSIENPEDEWAVDASACGGFYGSESDYWTSEIAADIKNYMEQNGLTEVEWSDPNHGEAEDTPTTLYIIAEGEAEMFRDEIEKHLFKKEVEAGADNPVSCYCDNGHEQNDTVCMYCYNHGRRGWNDPEVGEELATCNG